jgi:hypothetical protein
MDDMLSRDEGGGDGVRKWLDCKQLDRNIAAAAAANFMFLSLVPESNYH